REQVTPRSVMALAPRERVWGPAPGSETWGDRPRMGEWRATVAAQRGHCTGTEKGDPPSESYRVIDSPSSWVTERPLSDSRFCPPVALRSFNYAAYKGGV